MPRPRLVGDKDRLILQEDVKRLLEALDEAVAGKAGKAFIGRSWRTSRMLVRLALQSGLRTSEIARLQVRDCDLASRPYRILVRGGKKRKADHVDEVLIPESLGEELRAWTDGWPATRYVFGPTDGPPWRSFDRRWIYELGKRAIRACALNPKFSNHTFRHRFLTSLFQESDGNLLLVQRQARHRSLQPTTTYLHMADLEAETARVVNEVGFGSRSKSRKRPKGDGTRRRHIRDAMVAESLDRRRRRR